MGTKEEWDNVAPPKCPDCGRETFRFIGRLCPQCAGSMPGEMAAYLTQIGLPATVEDNTVVAVLFDHQIQLSFSSAQSLVYYQPARQAERQLFRHLERDLKSWAHQRGLGFATREGIQPI